MAHHGVEDTPCMGDLTLQSTDTTRLKHQQGIGSAIMELTTMLVDKTAIDVV